MVLKTDLREDRNLSGSLHNSIGLVRNGLGLMREGSCLQSVGDRFTAVSAAVSGKHQQAVERCTGS